MKKLLGVYRWRDWMDSSLMTSIQNSNTYLIQSLNYSMKMPTEQNLPSMERYFSVLAWMTPTKNTLINLKGTTFMMLLNSKSSKGWIYTLTTFFPLSMTFLLTISIWFYLNSLLYCWSSISAWHKARISNLMSQDISWNIFLD